jgi:hypothetical protein
MTFGLAIADVSILNELLVSESQVCTPQFVIQWLDPRSRAELFLSE